MNTAILIVSIELKSLFVSGVCLAPVVFIASAMSVNVKKETWFNIVSWGAVAIVLLATACAALS